MSAIIGPRGPRGPGGPTACMTKYLVVEPHAPGNDTDRWMSVLDHHYRKALDTGRHDSYMASRYATREAAQAHVDRLNTPLYPPTNPDMPREEYWRAVEASTAEITAAQLATERRRRTPRTFGQDVFDLPVDRVPHTYPAIPTHTTDEGE